MSGLHPFILWCVWVPQALPGAMECRSSTPRGGDAGLRVVGRCASVNPIHLIIPKAESPKLICSSYLLRVLRIFARRKTFVLFVYFVDELFASLSTDSPLTDLQTERSSPFPTRRSTALLIYGLTDSRHSRLPIIK